MEVVAQGRKRAHCRIERRVSANQDRRRKEYYILPSNMGNGISKKIKPSAVVGKEV
jgi:hypothetical protein